jgi:hypothetical protein
MPRQPDPTDEDHFLAEAPTERQAFGWHDDGDEPAAPRLPHASARYHARIARAAERARLLAVACALAACSLGDNAPGPPPPDAQEDAAPRLERLDLDVLEVLLTSRSPVAQAELELPPIAGTTVATLVVLGDFSCVSVELGTRGTAACSTSTSPSLPGHGLIATCSMLLVESNRSVHVRIEACSPAVNAIHAARLLAAPLF